MTVLEDIYKFIGENNLGVTGSEIRWKCEGSPYIITITLANSVNFKYYIEMILKADISKNITMTDDKVINYNCSEEDMKHASSFVKHYMENLDNIFPHYINLRVGDKYICIEDKKITSDVEYNIVKKLYKLIHSDTITRLEYEIVEKKDSTYILKNKDQVLNTYMNIHLEPNLVGEGIIRLSNDVLLLEYYKNNRYICHRYGLSKNILFLIEILDNKVILDIITQNSLNIYDDKNGDTQLSKNRFRGYREFLELHRKHD
jgi:hypothetical protein